MLCELHELREDLLRPVVAAAATAAASAPKLTADLANGWAVWLRPVVAS
jgi:hypothetical protein